MLELLSGIGNISGVKEWETLLSIRNVTYSFSPGMLPEAGGSSPTRVELGGAEVVAAPTEARRSQQRGN